MIHVCMALYDRNGHYSKFAGTTILSIFQHTKEKITIHILHDSTLTQGNREKFQRLVKKYKQKISFYDVEKLAADQIEKFRTFLSDYILDRFSMATFYRIFIMDSLPKDISKVIYLDYDIIVNLDINELWKVDLGKNVIAAVPVVTMNHANLVGTFAPVRHGFIKADESFNNGVLVIALDKMRALLDADKDLFVNGAKLLAEKGEMHFADQDIFGILFAKKCLHLPNRFNYDALKWRKKIDQLQPVIYHFTEHGLSLNLNDVANRLWFETFLKTPWFSIDSFGNLYDAFKKNFEEDHRNLIRFTKIFQNRKRVFFIHESQRQQMEKIFSITESDIELIYKGNAGHPNNLVNVMRQLKSQEDKIGKCIFLLMYQPLFYENFFRDFFTRQGFTEYEDFINMYDYISEADGYPIDAMKFLGEM